jgi:uncharacterized protein YraI
VPPANLGPSINTSTWIAQYYNNTALSGSPSVIQTEVNPTRNWGTGAPFLSVPADNFSARWTSTQNLTAGNYQVSVSSDDAARVIVNGVVVINQFSGPAGQTTNVQLTLPAGANTFVIEYVEISGNAYLQYSLNTILSAPVVSPTTAPVVGSASLRVNTFELNVRATPATNGTVLVKVRRDQTFQVVGRTADSTWWQIVYDGRGSLGWVFGNFVVVTGGQNVPVTSGSATINLPLTGFRLTTTAEVNLRAGPSSRAAVIGRVPNATTVDIVGRSANGRWWQVKYLTQFGWISASFVNVPSGTDLSRIPVNG